MLVAREEINPTIEGIDFGGRTYVLARSTSAVLIWVMGHSWSVNGFQRYSGPHMTLLPDRTGSVHKQYKDLCRDQRLSRALLNTVRDKILTAFDDETFRAIYLAAGAPRRTVLVEGGGPRLMPSRYYGEAEYLRWRDLPAEDRGFLLPAAALARDRNSFGYKQVMGDEADR